MTSSSSRRWSKKDLARFCIVPLAVLFFLYLYTSNQWTPGIGKEVVVQAKRQPLTEYELTSGNGSLSQDDPRLLAHILDIVLLPPSPKGKGVGVNWTVVSGVGSVKEVEEHKLSRYILDLFNQKTGGSFIECGANDGEFLSNTMFLEKEFGWSGLLIEVDPNPLKVLVNRNRNAWIAQSCISKDSQPRRIQFLRHNEQEGLSFIPGTLSRNRDEYHSFQAQCFPLYSILLAINQTTVDYFAMDMEGAELDVLQGLPWDKVVIKVLSIEVFSEYVEPVKSYMAKVGYLYVKTMTYPFVHDQIFVRKDVVGELNQTLFKAKEGGL